MKPYAIFTPPGAVPPVHPVSYWTPWHLAELAAVLAFFAVALVIALLTMIRDWKETALCKARGRQLAEVPLSPA